jgi:hypothetical protein
VQLVTLETEPKIIELRGDEVEKVNHAYGTNGIITELEIALAPCYPWAEFIVTFADFITAAKFGQALSDSDGIVKKMVSVHSWPIPAYFIALKDYLPTGKAAVLLIVSDSDRVALESLIKEYNGELTYYKTPEETQKGNSILEFTWNHTTLHARSCNPKITYLQAFYFNLATVEKLYNYFGEEIMMHLEFLKFQGKVIPAGLPLLEFTTETRLNEIIAIYEQQGAAIANPHTYIMEDGGSRQINPLQLEFKKLVDPYGLNNPGKMRAWVEARG